MPKLYCPIHKEFLIRKTYCTFTQLFGMNPNNGLYGPEGHTGLDIRTIGTDYWDWEDGKMKRSPRDEHQQRGRIPIVASHDGILEYILYDNKQGIGWGARITAPPEGDVQYRTLSWHIESPWRSLKLFSGIIKSIAELRKLFVKERVSRGAIIAIGGNSGQSTGPHLHFRLDKREMVNGKWGAWKIVNPLPYLADRTVIYQYQINKGNNKYFYMGKELNVSEKNRLIQTNKFIHKKLV